MKRFGKVPKINLSEDFGVTFWAGDLFVTRNGPEKKCFVEGCFCGWGFRGIPPAQMNSMVPRTHMGKLLCPKTPLKIISRQIPQIQKIGAGPWPIPEFSLFPLGGLLLEGCLDSALGQSGCSRVLVPGPADHV